MATTKERLEGFLKKKKKPIVVKPIVVKPIETRLSQVTITPSKPLEISVGFIDKLIKHRDTPWKPFYAKVEKIIYHPKMSNRYIVWLNDSDDNDKPCLHRFYMGEQLNYRIKYKDEPLEYHNEMYGEFVKLKKGQVIRCTEYIVYGKIEKKDVLLLYDYDYA